MKLTFTSTPMTPEEIEKRDRDLAELPKPKLSPVDSSDSRYNRSPKGKARQKRYREANREKRRAYDRERMAHLRGNLLFEQREAVYYLTVRRPRELAAQRVRIVEKLAEIDPEFDAAEYWRQREEKAS